MSGGTAANYCRTGEYATWKLRPGLGDVQQLPNPERVATPGRCAVEALRETFCAAAAHLVAGPAHSPSRHDPASMTQSADGHHTRDSGSAREGP
jgi:hypothetical protein